MIRWSAGMVVIRREPTGWRYLLLRSYGHWDFPKGMVEPGETALHAAYREVREESGIGAPVLAWGEVHHDTEPYGTGKVARYYLGLTHAQRVQLGVNPELGRPEHHEYRWLDHRRARELLVPRVSAALDWAVALAGPDCPISTNMRFYPAACTGAAWEGKFLQLNCDGAAYLLFAAPACCRYHNQLLARFLDEQDITHHWASREALAYDRQRVKIVGGGRFRMDAGDGALYVWDNSQAYGRFDENLLRSQLAAAGKPWDSWRLLNRQ